MPTKLLIYLIADIAKVKQTGLGPGPEADSPQHNRFLGMPHFEMVMYTIPLSRVAQLSLHQNQFQVPIYKMSRFKKDR
jgi:hypothetical protein